MTIDLLEEQSSGPIDGDKASVYMFLKLFKLALETDLIYLEAFHHLLYGMLFVAPLQCNANEGLVIVNCTYDTINEALNGDKLLVQFKSAPSSSLKLRYTSNFFVINSISSADETEGRPSCGVADEVNSRAGFVGAASKLWFELGIALAHLVEVVRVRGWKRVVEAIKFN